VSIDNFAWALERRVPDPGLKFLLAVVADVADCDGVATVGQYVENTVGVTGDRLEAMLRALVSLGYLLHLTGARYRLVRRDDDRGAL
jgi:hypothetical protein